jgi:tRNA-dihydrouridine synthase B
MAGYTNRVFRKTAYDHGACFAYTEMISAKSVFIAPRVVGNMLPDPTEPFTGVQLYGVDASWMLKAAAELQTHGKFIDVNAGCPVKKVIKKGMGGALLADLEKLLNIVKTLKENLSVPITVKTRIGWDKDEVERIYKNLVNVGVDAMVIHARTVKQGFKGKVNWKSLSKIKEKSIPLFVSGDIFSPEDAIRALEESNADGVVIARGAIGNPWIFSQVRSLLKKGKYEEPSDGERIRVMINHLKMNVETFGEAKGITEFRKLVAGYTKGMQNAREFRINFMKLKKFSYVMKLITESFGVEAE